MKQYLFCPNPHCRLHRNTDRKINLWYAPAGSYATKAFGRVKRYRCAYCGKYFSDQTFSIDYYAKRTLSYQSLFGMVITTSSVRDMARAFKVKPDTILNKLSRLARGALSALSQMRKEIVLTEDLVADGFETFTVSQYFPRVINLLVGKASQLIYWFDHVTIRRKGQMTETQKERRKALELVFKADPKGIRTSFTELSDDIAQLLCNGSQKRIFCYTDEHKTYEWVMRYSLAMSALIGQGRLTHIRIPSTEPRTVTNHLFSVNYIDRQLRKDLAECVRETVCFGRNVSRSVDRLAVYFMYHNLYKPYREQQGDTRSHAEVAGVSAGKVEKMKRGIFSERTFFHRSTIEGPLLKAWKRLYPTPLKEEKEYLPGYVYAA